MGQGATTFDVVVIGGGTTGCVLATRLSERADRSVLLMEAGADVPDVASLPAALAERPANAVWDPQYLWSYPETTLNPAVRGRILGGSGAINGCAFVRGIPEDYDSWGLPEWRFEAVLPAFRRMERDADFADAWHGTDGPVPVRRFARDDWHPLQTALYEGARECGYDEKADINAPFGEGVGPLPRNDPQGLRMSAALTHLAPVRGRPNLTVWSDTVVSRILVDGDRAVGAEVLRDRAPVTVRGGETILCAGAIESPRLLVGSGIGPAPVLEDLGIGVVHDLPGVAENLRDHPVVKVGARCDDDAAHPELGEPQQVVVTYTATGSELRADMQILAAPEWRGNARDGAPASDFVLITTLELPRSRGRLRFERRHGELTPRFEFGFLDDERDRARYRDAARRSVALLESDAFASLTGTCISPAPAEHASDDALDDWVARTLRVGQHSCGTCRMGPDDDPGAVVDAAGRVRGMDGLRVADLSIVPDNVRGNTNATAFMVAEHIAELIEEGR